MVINDITPTHSQRFLVAIKAACSKTEFGSGTGVCCAVPDGFVLDVEAFLRGIYAKEQLLWLEFGFAFKYSFQAPLIVFLLVVNLWL